MSVKSTIIGCVLLATLALAIIHDTSTPNPATKKYQESPLFTTFCKNKMCVKVNMRKVLRYYPNLFVPVARKRSQLEQKITLNYPHKRMFDATRTAYNSDLDTCCPTEFLFDNLPVRTNIYGQERVIVKCSLFKQVIPTGRCLQGTCRACELVNRTMSILVVKFTDKSGFLPLEFDQFEIPVYCTCLSSS